MHTKLDIRLTQKLIMTPQLQQAIKLLQLSKLELQQTINQALMENPFLDEVPEETAESDEDEMYKTTTTSESDSKGEVEAEQVTPLDGMDLKWDDYLSDDGVDTKELSYFKDSEEDAITYEQTVSRPSSLSEHLSWQLNLSTSDPVIKDIGEAIIGNIDDNGYLAATMEEISGICGVSGVSKDIVLGVLTLIQGFDPPGIAARDLRECLLIQIDLLGFKDTIVETIVSEHLPDFEKKRFPVIARKLHITLDDLSHAIKIIERLEPKPGRSFYSSDNLYIVPDVFVIKHEGEYLVILSDDGLPRLKLNPTYKRMLKKGSDLAEDARGYLEDKFRSAIWMIRSIEQRNRTIYKVAQSIVRCQEEFLEKGINYLKPLTLREIADDINMHESTVSRVTNNKYMCTPQGIFQLKYFFSSGLSTSDGNSCSSTSVRDMLQKLIAEENPKKPYSDQQIMEFLKEQQIEIARRTVAKYRKELKISSASRRRKLLI